MTSASECAAFPSNTFITDVLFQKYVIHDSHIHEYGDRWMDASPPCLAYPAHLRVLKSPQWRLLAARLMADVRT